MIQGIGEKKSRLSTWGEGLKRFFDGKGIVLVLDRKFFFYHYKYIQKHACENDICEYRNVEQIKFFIKTRSSSFNSIFLILKRIKYVVLYNNKFCKTITLNFVKSFIEKHF